MGFEFQGRGFVLTAFFCAELGVFDVTGVAVWVAEVQAWAFGMIELIWRHVLTEIVSPVVSEPDIACLGIPIEAYSVPDSSGKDLKLCAIRVHPGDGSIRIALVTDIAGSSNRQIELAIRPKRNKLPAMGRIFREIIFDNHIFRVIKIFLNIVESEDAADLSNIEVPIFESNSIRHVQFLSQNFYHISLMIAIGVLQCINFPPIPRRHKDSPFLTSDQGPGIGHLRENVDLEPLGQFHVAEIPGWDCFGPGQR